MSRSTIPLSVLDLVPIASGSNAAAAFRNTLDLAQRAEAAGYARYWIAEHHLNPGVAGVAPALVVSLVAAATEHIRVGSGAVQLGHHTPLSVVEQFGIVDALHPGRIDLGLGRSGFRRPPPPGADAPDVPPGFTTPRGLVIPAKPSLGALLLAPRYAAQRTLLQQPGAETPPYEEQIAEILALLRGEYCSDDGYPVSATPGEGAQVEIWILGSSGGDERDARRRARSPVRRQLPREPGHRARSGRGVPRRVPPVDRAHQTACARVRRRRSSRPTARPHASSPPVTGSGC